jgi:tRNA(fMet)-specific endonuclease VapC
LAELIASSEDVAEMVSDLRITLLPFSSLHAHRLFGLPLRHREPFDRMIIAVALSEGIPLIGSDSRFPFSADQGLRVVWN